MFHWLKTSFIRSVLPSNFLPFSPTLSSPKSQSLHWKTTMSSHLWPNIETSKVSSAWFRPLQPAREDLSLAKFEEILEQERKKHIDKGVNLPFHGKTEMDNADDDEDGDEAEEESEGGEQDDDMDAQQGSGSPTNGTTGTTTTTHDV